MTKPDNYTEIESVEKITCPIFKRSIINSQSDNVIVCNACGTTSIARRLNGKIIVSNNSSCYTGTPPIDLSKESK